MRIWKRECSRLAGGRGRIVSEEVELVDHSHDGGNNVQIKSSRASNSANNQSQTLHWQQELHVKDTEDDFQLKE